MADTAPNGPSLSRRERNRLAQRRHRTRIREMNEQQRNARVDNGLFDKPAPCQSGPLMDNQQPWTVEPAIPTSDELSFWNTFGFAQSPTDGFNLTVTSSKSPLQEDALSALPVARTASSNASPLDSASTLMSGSSHEASIPAKPTSAFPSVDATASRMEFRSVSPSTLRQRRRKPYCGAVDGSIPSGRTPLHMICDAGSQEQVKRLLAAGANSQARDQFGMTPLHVAARRGNTAAITALLEAGVLVDTRDKQGMTALHHASWCGYDEAMAVLLQGGASSDAIVMPDES